MTSRSDRLHRTKLLGAAVLILACLSPQLAGAQDPEPAPAAEQGPVQASESRFEMVLVHGLGASNEIWDKVLPFLKGTFKVWTFELSGHGTTQPIMDPTIEAEATRLEEFIAANGIKYPTLVGHGMGGLITLRYSLDHPAKVHRLIMMDTAPKQLASDDQKAQAAEALALNYDRFVASYYLRLSSQEAITETTLDMALRTDSASFISMLMSSFEFDMTGELPGLSVPLLIIGSQLLFPIPESCQPVLTQIGYGNARSLSFKRLGESGHYMMLEKPVRLASVLLAFGVTAEYLFDVGY